MLSHSFLCCSCCCPQPCPPCPPTVFLVAFTKVDSRNGAPLAGATFELIQNNQVVGRAISNGNGRVDLGFHSPGIYTLIETVPPSGFEPIVPVQVIVSDVGITIGGMPIDLPIENIPISTATGTIIIRYVSEEGIELLPSETLIVPSGSYGPYVPIAILDYVFVGLGVGSAPAQGTIVAGETKIITFVYAREVPLTGTIVIIYENLVGIPILPTEIHHVLAGIYGPYTPPSITGYVFVSLAPGSDFPVGTIGADQTRIIIFQYSESGG